MVIKREQDYAELETDQTDEEKAHLQEDEHSIHEY